LHRVGDIGVRRRLVGAEWKKEADDRPLTGFYPAYVWLTGDKEPAGGLSLGWAWE
jgi:hypothetical protein